MHYVDTSVIVAALTIEERTPAAQAWLYGRAAPELLISDWVITEFSSALSLKLRTRQIDMDGRSTAQSSFNRFLSESLALVTVTPGQFRTAARFAEHQDLGLRAGDALHLAIASEYGATLCSLDRRLVEAGPALGVPTTTP